MAATKNTRTCRANNCNGAHKAKGYCAKHYQRLTKHGSPIGGGTSKGAALQFLRDLLDAPESHICIEWPYHRQPSGYGYVQWDGQQTGAHRVVLLLKSSPVSPDMHAAHSCGNKGCVNPAHIRWATVGENHADKLKHGTDNRGERNHQSKLTAAEVLEIREIEGETYASIADRYGVSFGVIGSIRRRNTWRHV